VGDDQPAQSWAEQRRHAANEHAASQQRKKDAESQQARAIVAAFVAEAQALGIPPEPLTASPYTGRGRYRTNRTGWYIRQNRSLAIGTDGEYYILTVPASLRARLSGASLPAVEPPLVTGAGGRDGESIPLDTLLRMRLEAGNSFP
jgi:hypothetical protein